MEFGGTGVSNGTLSSVEGECHGQEQYIELAIGPLSVIYLKGKPKPKRRTKAAAEDDKKAVKKTAPKAAASKPAASKAKKAVK